MDTSSNSEDEQERDYSSWRSQLTSYRYQHRELNMTAKLNDTAFKEHFRLSRIQFEILLQELGPHLKEGCTKYAIKIETKVLMTLRFLAQGSYQLGVGNDLTICISRPSVSIILTEVIEVMNNVLCPKYIRFPDSAHIRRTALLFLNRYNIPNVGGCIDGTHIRLAQVADTPDHPEFLYVNRKSFHSLNVLVICDAEYRILAVNAKFPGSANDSFVYTYSSARELVHQIFGPSSVWLLGDSAYALEPTLMTPIRTPRNYQEELYNQHHRVARSLVERCIGVWKQRWRGLKDVRGLHYSPEKAGKIVNATAALHNFCLSYGDDYRRIMFPREDDIDLDLATEDEDYFHAGEAIRNYLVEYIFGARIRHSRLAAFLEYLQRRN